MCFTPSVIVIIHDVAYYEADLKDFISSEQSINKSQDLLNTDGIISSSLQIYEGKTTLN